MRAYVYVVWFRDLDAWPEDQDREWAAMIAIEAESAAAAQSWGDRLARERQRRRPRDVFLWSKIDDDDDPGDAPRVAYGEEADDDKIGW